MELKLCPFCGCSAMIEPYKVRKGYEASIHCSNCLIVLSTITYDTEELAISAVIAVWNRRA